MRVFYDTEFIEYPGTIDLISIGMVTERGDKFYRVSSEFDESKANLFVREHVLPNLGSGPRHTRVQIAQDIIETFQPSESNQIELWGYYSAYDHVALCWLFGTMMQLPTGMPMYTRDLKQLADALGNPELPPPPKASHNALADALWTMEAYNYLRRFKAELLASTWKPW